MHQSKIEQAQEKMEELRQELRSEVEEEVRSNLRRRTWRSALLRVFGCCGIYLATLLAVPVFLAYLVARTGLIEVPFFSSRVAHERSASRTVMASAVNAEQLLSEKLRSLLPVRGEVPDQLTITLTESELTALLRSFLKGDARASAITRDTAQVAITADGIELFARVAGSGGRESTVLLRGVPSIQSAPTGASGEGKLATEFREVAIGNLGIPRFLANTIAQSFLSQLPVLKLGGEGPIPSLALERITLGEGAVQVTLKKVK
jgi:hypothetical protein